MNTINIALPSGGGSYPKHLWTVATIGHAWDFSPIIITFECVRGEGEGDRKSPRLSVYHYSYTVHISSDVSRFFLLTFNASRHPVSVFKTIDTVRIRATTLRVAEATDRQTSGSVLKARHHSGNWFFSFNCNYLFFFFFFFSFVRWKFQSPRWRWQCIAGPSGFRTACGLRECGLARFPFWVARRWGRTAVDVLLSDCQYRKGTAPYGQCGVWNTATCFSNQQIYYCFGITKKKKKEKKKGYLRCLLPPVAMETKLNGHQTTCK